MSLISGFCGRWFLVKRFLLTLALIGALVGALPTLASATVGGENGRIAFARGGDIWTVNRAGTKQIHVTQGSVRDEGPAWSPNGRWIAFTRTSNSGLGSDSIYRVRADGTGLRRIVAGGGPAWAPDGKRIAYAVRSSRAIWVANVDGTHRRALIRDVDIPDPYSCEDAADEGGCWLGSPAWGPFGKRIAFFWQYAIDEQGGFATVKAADGSGYKDITGGFSEDYSPDGAWILFSQYLYGPDTEESYVGYVPWNGGDERRVVSRSAPCCDALASMSAGWSPDGKRIVVGSEDEGIRTMDLDGSNVRFLAVGNSPSWQPLQR